MGSGGFGTNVDVDSSQAIMANANTHMVNVADSHDDEDS